MSLDEPIPFRLCNYNSNKNPSNHRSIKRLPKRKQTLRHNPQPLYVKHFYGLQNMPICRVVCTDKIKREDTNTNSINTLTGLPILRLRDLPPIERAIPTKGMVPINEPWRQELHALTESILENLSMQEECARLIEYHPYPINRPVTGFGIPMATFQQRPLLSRSKSNLIGREKEKLHSRPSTSRSYSSLIEREKELNQSRPSTSRSTLTSANRDREKLKSRCSTSRSSIAEDLERLFWNKSWESDYESQVLSLLGQVLGLFNIEEVKQWLARASDREKASIIRILETVFQSKMQVDENIPPATQLTPMPEEQEEEIDECVNDENNEEEIRLIKSNSAEETNEQQEIFDDRNKFVEEQEHRHNLDRLTAAEESFVKLKTIRPRTVPNKIRPMTCSVTPMATEMRKNEPLLRPSASASSSICSNNSQAPSVNKKKAPRIILRYKTANLNNRRMNIENDFEY